MTVPTHPIDVLPVSEFVFEEDGEAYGRLLTFMSTIASEISSSAPDRPLIGSPAYILDEANRLVRSVSPGPNFAEPDDLPIYKALQVFRNGWPRIRDGQCDGESLFAEDAGLWIAAMRGWPMGRYANMAAEFLIHHDLLSGRAVELGAGVGSCGLLIADHVNDKFVRSDRQIALLRRQRIRGKAETHDFDTPGPWENVDTFFAVNAVHCAKDVVFTLSDIKRMLNPGGVIILAEGNPVTDAIGTPWAMNIFFGLFKGWWDRGGFLTRDQWMGAFRDAGFRRFGYGKLRAGDHDLGGLIWGVKN